MKKTNALRKIWYNLSANQRFLIRRLYYFPSDFKDSINRKSSESKLDAMITASGLTKVTTVDGFWKDKIKDKIKVEYQDILVLEKK